MIDLNRMVECFLDEAVRRQRDQCQLQDAAVIGALNDRGKSAESRGSDVRRWLKSYGVLQGLNKSDRIGVASAIIEFADARDVNVRLGSVGEIVDNFNDLYRKCSPRVRPKKDETPRDLTSLTSKALWCCYPDTIPIFDSYSLRALWVVSRLIGLDRPADDMPYNPYNRFVAVWLHLYQSITIDDSRLNGYPYRVRVFDKILWIIGQPDFGKIPYS